MIVAYYPGGCGNRYINFLKNREYQTLNKSYEYNSNTINKNRYLLDNSIDESDDSVIILTHCLNYLKIKQYYPNHQRISALRTDFKSSLRRQWLLYGKQLYKTEVKDLSNEEILNSDLINLSSAFSSICYHIEYYNQFNPTIFNEKTANIIDCLYPTTKIAEVIIKELTHYQDNIFDFAWDLYEKFGPTAPIFTHYKDFFHL